VEIGFLTACMGDRPFEQIVAFAGEAGFDALEVACTPAGSHIDCKAVIRDKGKEVKRLLADHGVRISSLAAYTNWLNPEPAKRKELADAFKTVVEAANLLGVDTVCTIAGMAVPGKNKMQTIEQDFVEVFGPMVAHAKQHKVKVALENWFATLMQAPDHFERAFSLIKDRNFGLNYDPSHLMWAGVDYIGAVETFAKRIFHTHAKDCQVFEQRLRQVGVLGSGWWRYCIPGQGGIRWGEYVGALRRVGFNGVLSIEHEDGAVGGEEGLRLGRAYLLTVAGRG
jgi:sugar phosphate isomerase/epimerase